MLLLSCGNKQPVVGESRFVSSKFNCNLSYEGYKRLYFQFSFIRSFLCLGVGDVAELHPTVEIHWGEVKSSARPKQSGTGQMVSNKAEILLFFSEQRRMQFVFMSGE